MQELKQGELFVRTFERGVEDETLSCGTGVTAAAIVYAMVKNVSSPCKIKTLGGELSIYFEKQKTSFTNVYLEGPAEVVFKDALNDWGYYGAVGNCPLWFAGINYTAIKKNRNSADLTRGSP